MLLGGDEFLRSQRGNNNAYCQDNELSWFDWRELERNRDFFDFVRKAIAFTKRHTILQRRKFHSAERGKNDVPDLIWCGCDEHPDPWGDPEARTLCYQLDGSEEPSEVGDYRLFFIMNADWHLQRVAIPAPGALRWHRVVDTGLPAPDDFLAPGREPRLEPADHYLVNPRSTVVLIAR
jgi:glycogen operon protein